MSSWLGSDAIDTDVVVSPGSTTFVDRSSAMATASVCGFNARVRVRGFANDSGPWAAWAASGFCSTSRPKAEQKPDAAQAAQGPESLAKPRTRTRALKPQTDAVAMAEDRSTNVVEPGDTTTSVSMASEPSQEDIRMRAYQRYLE